MRNRRAQSPSRILVLHAGALGDCVLALHFIAAMKKAWGGPRITVAARSSIVRWAQRQGWFDEGRSIEEIGVHGLYDRNSNIPPLPIESLRGFDGIVSFLGGRCEIVSQRLAEASKCEVFAIDPKPTPGSTTHIVEQWVEQMRVHGLAVEVPSGAELEIRDRRALHHQLCSQLEVTTKRIILCHPGSGGLAKCCPLDVLERIVGELKARSCWVAWMAGPDELERFGTEYARRLERTAPVLYEESIELAADLAAGADVFIGNDAGMTHVAALCGVRTIALFGPTDPAIWRPLGPDCSVVSFSGDHRSMEALVRNVVSRVTTPE